MSPDARLAEMVSELEGAGVFCLVMGGHAVRFYGLWRYTNDVDLHVAPDQWRDLPARLARTNLLKDQDVREGPSWRPGAFRRFRIGTRGRPLAHYAAGLSAPPGRSPSPVHRVLKRTGPMGFADSSAHWATYRLGFACRGYGMNSRTAEGESFKG